MKRYLCFAMDYHDPAGGMEDCFLKTSDLQEAKSAVESEKEDSPIRYIYDVETDRKLDYRPSRGIWGGGTGDMKRYLCFAHDKYDGGGGMRDCVLKTDNIQEGKQTLEKIKQADSLYIYDTVTGQEIAYFGHLGWKE